MTQQNKCDLFGHYKLYEQAFYNQIIDDIFFIRKKKNNDIFL